MQRVQTNQDVSFKNMSEVFLKNKDGYVAATGSNTNGNYVAINNGRILFHPNTSYPTCRQSFRSYLRNAIIGTNNHFPLTAPGVSIDFSPAAKVNGETVFAVGGFKIFNYAGTSNPTFLVENQQMVRELMDMLVGNTCVMLDKANNELQIERRKVTGMAGDCTFEPTGARNLHYKVPSNFWFKSYPLMSLVTGMMRFVSNIVSQNNAANSQQNYFAAFTALVSREDIVKAINNNDAKLARENFEKIAPLIEEITPKGQTMEGFYPITQSTINDFRYFVDMGMDYWFPKSDIVDIWTQENGSYGIENFLSATVHSDMQDKKFRLKVLEFAEIWTPEKLAATSKRERVIKIKKAEIAA